MAFDLPRRSPSLRFVGSERELSTDEVAPMLGRARPNAPPPSSVRSPPMPPPTTSRVLAPLPPPTPRVSAARLSTMRGEVPSAAEDDELMTLCLDRDAIALALLPNAHEGSHVPRDPNAGPLQRVPHFRSQKEVARHNHAPTPRGRPSRGGSLPLGAWLFAAMIAGVVTFHFAPQARDSMQGVVRALASR